MNQVQQKNYYQKIDSKIPRWPVTHNNDYRSDRLCKKAGRSWLASNGTDGLIAYPAQLPNWKYDLKDLKFNSCQFGQKQSTV